MHPSTLCIVVAAAFSFDAKFIISLRVSFLVKCPFITLPIFVAALFSLVLFCKSEFITGYLFFSFSYCSLSIFFFVSTFFVYNVFGLSCNCVDGSVFETCNCLLAACCG